MTPLNQSNSAFIDGQNLYMGTRSDESPWNIDLVKLREYLLRKYHVRKAYYFLGVLSDEQRDLYESIQSAGFILMFKKHTDTML